MSSLKILVSNDDGVNAKGLKVLATALSEIADVRVIAPDRDRSAASHSLTVDRPLRVHQHENGFRSVNGTPTDAVHLGITYLEKDDLPDMVVSGINRGANLGDDALYSGTLAAAVEGRSLRLPALAVSLAGESYEYYETAANLVVALVSQLKDHPFARDYILNINVPDVPYDQLKGVAVTRLGSRHVAQASIKSADPRGREIFWIGPAGEKADSSEGTDFAAVANHYASITPISIDLTDHSAIDSLTNWISEQQSQGAFTI